MADNAVHEHDCDHCIYVGSYPARIRQAAMADVYLACDNSGYKYIVRYGEYGEYATTNVASRYVRAPLIDGIDPYA